MMIIRQKITEFLNDSFVRTIVRTFIFIMLLFVFIGIWKWPILPPQLPLFYSLPKSSEQLAATLLLLILPILSIIFFGIDFFLASLFYPKEKLGSFLLVIIGITTSLLLLIAFIKIILLVS